MRRTITVLAAGAFALGGVAVAAPAANAAKVLKPGAVTAVSVSAKTNGSAAFSWKAPAVKSGKTAKATSYVVACPGAKKATVKTTKATVVVTTSIATVSCTVTAYAGKTAGPAAKSAKFTVYHQYGVTSIVLAPAATAALAGYIDAAAPGSLVANADGSTTLSFPIVTSNDVASNDNAWAHAGALVVNGSTAQGDVTVPIGGLTIGFDAASTYDVPVFDLYGMVNGAMTPLLKLTSPEPNATNGNELDFNVSLTDNVQVVGLLQGLGLDFQPGTPLGTGSSTWN